ncbi:TIGR02285 family protein [Pseudomonas sp. LB3P31]
MATTRHRLPGCAKTEPSKLKRLLCSALHNRHALAVFALLAGLAAPVAAQAKETLIWLLRDLPPTMIFEGPKKGQGIVDRMLPLLIAGMPQYEHVLMRVNRARGMQMLQEESFTCDPALVWTKERAQWIAFSSAAFRAVRNGLVVRQNDRAVLDEFVVDGEVDLAPLLTSGKTQVGVVAERSYGQPIDSLLKQAPSGTLTAHHGNDAIASLLQMQRLGRLQVVLGYWPEIRYLANRGQIADDQLAFLPIKGSDKFLSGYIGCSNTAQGKQAISDINQLLRTLPRESLDHLYADWLDPQMRSDYLQDTRAFFEHQPQP